MPSTWMVRAGRGSYVFEDFEKKSCVAVGWAEKRIYWPVG